MIENESIFIAKIDGIIVGYVSSIIKVREYKGFRYRKQLDIDSICVDSELLVIKSFPKTQKTQNSNEF